jgi:dihydroorotase
LTRLLVKGARVMDPAAGLDEQLDLLVDANVIVGKGVDLEDEHAEVVDAAGLVAAPAFIDLHCHLRQPGQEHKETVASGSAAAVRGGFTTVCAMPNTTPVADNRGAIEALQRTASQDASIRILPIGAITLGNDGKELAELVEMAEAGAVAFSDDGRPVGDSHVMRRALEYSIIAGRPIVDHCEDSSLSAGGLMHEGWVSARLGLPGMPAAAEEATVARDIQLAGQTGARLHLAHVSTEGSVELIRRAKENGVEVTAEVTPHHLTLSHELVMGGDHSGEGLAYDTNCKVNPPLRTPDDVAACVAGLREGVIDCIATDHAPHASEDKLCEFGVAAFGISGLETAFALCHGLVAKGQIDLATLINRLTAGPARVFGLDESFNALGSLADGAPADIVLLDPGERWMVDPNLFASKGKNTPLAGRLLTGRVKATIASGVLVWDQLRETVAVD